MWPEGERQSPPEKELDEVADNLSRGDLVALETQGRF
jgi:hypothetical protein